MANIVCVPYSFTIKNNNGEFESLEVSNVEYDRYRIIVYFGTMEITGNDEIGYMFNIVFGEDSNSDSYSWDEASRVASIARPIGVQYSPDGIEWLNRAPDDTFALRFTHDGGETWGNPVFVGKVIGESNSDSSSEQVIQPLKPMSITLPVPHDDDGENMFLTVGFCDNEYFRSENVSNSQSCSNADFVRYICMRREPDCFKISSDGVFVNIPQNGIGAAYYGESVVLTIYEDRFNWYKPGNTYYVRARWEYQSGKMSDWTMFKATYDAIDMRPVQTESKDNDIEIRDDIEFTSSDLSDDKYIINNAKIGEFAVIDNDGYLIMPDEIQEGNNVEIDFTGFDVVGTWKILFIKYRVQDRQPETIYSTDLHDNKYTIINCFVGTFTVLDADGNKILPDIRQVDSNVIIDFSGFDDDSFVIQFIGNVKTGYNKVSLSNNNISGQMTVNFSNGRIQTYNMVGDVHLSTSNIVGVPFGLDMTIIISKPNGYELSITGTSTKNIARNEYGTYIIRAIMLNDVIVTISEVI